MKKNYVKGIMLLLFVSVATCLQAQNNFFTNQSEASFVANDQKRVIIPERFRTIKMDLNGMQNFLKTVPLEKNVIDRNQTPVIEIPMPNGSSAKFHVWERPVMEPGLEAKFPTIKTYLGQGITDKYAVLTLDMTEMGFHAMIISNVTGNVFIDPYDLSTVTNYMSYYRKDLKPRQPFMEDGQILNLDDNTSATGNTTAGKFPTSRCIGTQIRTYRLAVGCSNQYAKAATGLASPTKAQALAKIVTTVNRVTTVYELEASIHFNLVANNDLVVFVNANTDPFNSSNSNAGTLITASQTQITNLIGTANFDIGHTFSTGGGGLAGLGVICNSTQKARGITGSPQPTGDAYDIDYVAHEIGHQFSGNHTFNAATGSCSGNGANTANAEPGSGTTIMAYAGICGINDVGGIHQNPGAVGNQGWSDPQFHAGSLAEVYQYSISGTGNTCAVITNTSNTIPVASAGDAYTIPISTPFILTGSGSDADGDAITFSWEQMDVGSSFANWDATQTTNSKIPLFRSFPPTTNNFRYMPQLEDIISASQTIGERLPTVARNMAFRLTVRDNKAGNGGTCYGDVTIKVNATGGAFAVTYPSNSGELWYEGQTKTITWNKGSTNLTPFNATNVAIEMSIDGGYTFPIVLNASTPNDGTEDIIVTNDFTFSAKIRVRALGNIFYDMSDNDFTIAPNPVPVKWLDFTGQKERNNTVKLNWNVNEIDNHLYVVERSLDGERFSSIGEVAASTASGNNHSYSFTDVRPFASKNYYRIKQVDKNGGYSYSKVITITIDGSIGSWVVYPNPTTEKVNLFCNSNYNNMQIQIFDAIGKLVFTQTKEKAVKGEVVTVSLSNLARGIYSIKLQANNAETTTKKIIVQ
jgi:Metallo-peptidase family M12/Secretion system C-terminal sorting domain